jgi:small-conductance mechanosensitive channel
MEFLEKLTNITNASLGGRLIYFVLTGIAAWFLAIVLFQGIKFALKTGFKSTSKLVSEKLSKSFSLFFTVTILNLALPVFHFSDLSGVFIHKTLFILFVISFSLLLLKVASFVKGLIFERQDINVENNLSERKIRTQIDFIYKLIAVGIFVIAVSVILMSFEPVRQLGTSLLASAGIAGIIVGLAAQKSLTNLLAGFQIAFTQPIRLDDVVIVENEWGRIEEITLTYVVVRIWDQRRLIVPIAYFIEKPFQNWTRVSADILGTVFFYADYSLPVDAIRGEVTRLLKNNKLWDGKVNVVQVTDTTEKTMQLRVLISSGNSGNAWDLRCFLREKLIEFVQRQYPEALPKFRAEPLVREQV